MQAQASLQMQAQASLQMQAQASLRMQAQASLQMQAQAFLHRFSSRCRDPPDPRIHPATCAITSKWRHLTCNSCASHNRPPPTLRLGAPFSVSHPRTAASSRRIRTL